VRNTYVRSMTSHCSLSQMRNLCRNIYQTYFLHNTHDNSSYLQTGSNFQQTLWTPAGHNTAWSFFYDRQLSLADKVLWDITTTQVNSALHLSGVAKSSTSFRWGKGGKVAAAGWQVTLCDPIWHVISRSRQVISTCVSYVCGLCM